MSARKARDGSEMVSAVLLTPVLVMFLFAIASLSVGAFQRQLVEYGVSNIANVLDPSVADLPERARDDALRDAILQSVPLLARTANRLTVSDTRVEVTRTEANSPLASPQFGRDASPWAGRTVGHVDSQQLRVRARVSYEVPPLFQSPAWHAGSSLDTYTVDLDRTFIVSRREEVS